MPDQSTPSTASEVRVREVLEREYLDAYEAAHNVRPVFSLAHYSDDALRARTESVKAAHADKRYMR